MRSKDALSLASLVFLWGCARPWSVVVRYEGGMDNPQEPLIVQVQDGFTNAASNVMEGRCLRVQLQNAPSAARPVKITVTRANGAVIGTTSIGLLAQGGTYIPVDGQLGMVTIRHDGACP